MLQEFQSQEGKYMVDWAIIFKIIQAKVRAIKKNEYSKETSSSESTWYNPFSWQMPTIYTVEVDWQRIKAETDPQAEALYKEMNKTAERSMTKAATELRSMRMRTQSESAQFRAKMLTAHRKSSKEISEAVKGYELGTQMLKLTRDTSASLLVVGATVLSGGAAASALAVGAGMKGTAKYQDLGDQYLSGKISAEARFGAAAYETVGTVIFAVLPIKGGSSGEMMAIVLEPMWTAAAASIEGASAEEAIGKGFEQFVAGRLGGVINEEFSKSLKRMSFSVTTRTIDMAADGLRGHAKLAGAVSGFVSGEASKKVVAIPGALEKQMLGNSGSPRVKTDVSSGIILYDDALLQKAIVKI